MTTKAEALANVPSDQITHSRKIGNNTFEYSDQAGNRYIRLHMTDIICFQPDGKILINSGGWRTVTTKDRLNSLVPGLRVWSEKGTWMVSYEGVESPFSDHMVLPIDPGEVAKAWREADAESALAKRINAFARKIDGLDKLPIPSGGDCWICMAEQGQIKPGEYMGVRSSGDHSHLGDTSHLLSHIDEGYIHGTLIVNALLWSGQNNPGLIFQMGIKDMAKRAVRRYLRRRLGLSG